MGKIYIHNLGTKGLYVFFRKKKEKRKKEKINDYIILQGQKEKEQRRPPALVRSINFIEHLWVVLIKSTVAQQFVL